MNAIAFISLIATLLISAVCAILGYELCFTDTFLGGYLPFVTIAFAPLATYVIGCRSAT